MMENKKFKWHSLEGDYVLKDGETVLVAAVDGYILATYDAKRDIWKTPTGDKEGGVVMMPLPDVQYAFDAAWENDKHLPFADNFALKRFISENADLNRKARQLCLDFCRKCSLGKKNSPEETCSCNELYELKKAINKMYMK